MRDNYDFSKGERGKYVDKYKNGANIVVLDPEVAKAFPTSDSVNAALRKLMSQSSPKSTPGDA